MNIVVESKEQRAKSKDEEKKCIDNKNCNSNCNSQLAKDFRLAESKPENQSINHEPGQIIIGNVSYQITGLPPFTDSPFATVGNDWSLPHTILSERHLDEIRDMSRRMGLKMRDSGWCGLFGIDVIYDEERDQLKLLEINARQPASTAFESQLQEKFRGQEIKGSTIFEAHLAALRRGDLRTEGRPTYADQIEINDGAQLVQRVIQGSTLYKSRYKVAPCTEKIAALNAAGYTTIPYSNTKPNADLLRIQSDKGLMEKHGKFNSRGEKIVEIL